MIFEKDGVRIPGRFEFYWRRIGFAFKFIYARGDGDKWPWILHVHFLWLSLFLHFPCGIVPRSKREPWQRDWQEWGFSQTDDALHLYWNEKSKVWWLPIVSKVFQRHEVRKADGSWVPYVGSYERDKEPDGREELTFPYAYKLRSGAVQERTATIHVDRMAWRPKWLTWTALFENVRQGISVEFSDEVGERTGSWKGGCVGCGYAMLPGETAEQTLRRMERERVFN